MKNKLEKFKSRKQPPIERRFSVTGSMEVRASDDGPKIEGHAAVFNSLSVPMFGFREKINEGAFTKTIQEADVRALFNHDPNFVLGRNRSNTLELKEDSEGLHYSIKPPDTQQARDLVTSIERGDISQSSFGFRTVKDAWTDDSEDGIVRTLLEVRLFDVSPVTFPAYEATDSQVRSLAAFAGIDGDALHEATRRAMMHEDLDDEHRDILRSVSEFLKGCAQEPGDDPHSENEPSGTGHSERSAEDPESSIQSLGILRKKLDLMDIEV